MSIAEEDHIRKQILHDCRIVGKRDHADGIFTLELESRAIAREARAGQFVNVDCGRFLRRPVSLSGVDREKGTFFLSVRVKGEGTAYLDTLAAGDILSVQGPLGNGFDLSGVTKCIAVGGGIGIFPLLFLLDEAAKHGIGTAAVCGYRSLQESFCTTDIRTRADRVCFASDAGDMDFCGNAAQALADARDLAGAAVFTCGPVPMMKGVAAFCAERGLACQVSLEERMACGTGVCLVCACKVRPESGGDAEYRRCCCDGPVFGASEVIWD